MISGIYDITNIITKKRYIGSAVDIERRWSNHKSRLNNDKHYNSHLQRAWNKYGEENFVFSIIERILEKSALLNVEQTYLNNLKPEYNMSPTAGGGDQGEEARRKISLASRGNTNNLGRKFSVEHRAKISLALLAEKSYWYGRELSEEHKLKISKSCKGRVSPNKGHVFSEETKRKMSVSACHRVQNRENK